jgi:hypothetical protein
VFVCFLCKFSLTGNRFILFSKRPAINHPLYFYGNYDLTVGFVPGVYVPLKWKELSDPSHVGFLKIKAEICLHRILYYRNITLYSELLSTVSNATTSILSSLLGRYSLSFDFHSDLRRHVTKTFTSSSLRET